MANNLTPGCTRTPGGRYLPIVVESHSAVYFHSNSASTAEAAIEHAERCIKDQTYQFWHGHKLAS